jgi:hypothetical protein
MSEANVRDRTREVLAASGLDAAALEDLAGQLVWRIGRVSDDGPVTVRVALASSAALFQELPRLRTASDNEIEAAVDDNSLRVEWVGVRPRSGGERGS